MYLLSWHGRVCWPFLLKTASGLSLEICSLVGVVFIAVAGGLSLAGGKLVGIFVFVVGVCRSCPLDLWACGIGC